MMELIIETDLGHDPDDMFAILWLMSVGVNIRAITVVPGDPDQIAIARFLCKAMGLDIPIGAISFNRTKPSSGGVHYDLLNKYKHSLEACPDDLGEHIIAQVINENTEFLIIGPAICTGRYLRDYAYTNIRRATMQGGFLPYHVHDIPCKHLPQFEGKNHAPSFNLNGDRKGAMHFLKARVNERRFVSKNLCHGIYYTKEVHEHIRPRNHASSLFKEAMDLLLQHHGHKKFHDPTAAVCHLYPDIAKWVQGWVIKAGDGWTTQVTGDGDYIIADIREDLLWDHILNFQ